MKTFTLKVMVDWMFLKDCMDDEDLKLESKKFKKLKRLIEKALIIKDY